LKRFLAEMVDPRTVEDRLRAEYATLVVKAGRVAAELETLSRFAVNKVTRTFSRNHERVIVKGRVKACESAIEALRRRQEGKVFDESTPEAYSLLTLKDLVGVRVLVFPKEHIPAIRDALAHALGDWEPDHVYDDARNPIAFKHHGFLRDAEGFPCEYQVVPMLIGLFWEVEHAALYKPDQIFRGVANHPRMKERNQAVIDALIGFEEEFENQMKLSTT
jgi:hypothetical protein